MQRLKCKKELDRFSNLGLVQTGGMCIHGIFVGVEFEEEGGFQRQVTGNVSWVWVVEYVPCAVFRMPLPA